MIARSCLVCGARTAGGTRCARHSVGGARMRSCVVCGAASLANYCPAHDPRAVYTSARWQRVRREVLARDGHTCTVHGCGRGYGLDVHHVVPMADGGDPYDLGNLVTLCEAHHDAVTAAHRTNRAGMFHVKRPGDA